MTNSNKPKEVQSNANGNQHHNNRFIVNAPLTEQPARARPNIVILYIDDDHIEHELFLRRIIKSSINDRINLHFATDDKTGVELYRKLLESTNGNPDFKLIVILDGNLGSMSKNGFETCKEIRRIASDHGVVEQPIILYSATVASIKDDLREYLEYMRLDVDCVHLFDRINNFIDSGHDITLFDGVFDKPMRFGDPINGYVVKKTDNNDGLTITPIPDLFEFISQTSDPKTV